MQFGLDRSLAEILFLVMRLQAQDMEDISKVTLQERHCFLSLKPRCQVTEHMGLYAFTMAGCVLQTALIGFNQTERNLHKGNPCQTTKNLMFLALLGSVVTP